MHRVHRAGCDQAAALVLQGVADAEKILLIDALQYPEHRLLDNFIFQRSDAQRSLSTIRFRPVIWKQGQTLREGLAR